MFTCFYLNQRSFVPGLRLRAGSERENESADISKMRALKILIRVLKTCVLNFKLRNIRLIQNINVVSPLSPVSEASREVENFNWRKKHTPIRI